MDWTELASVRKDGKIRVLSRRGKKLHGSRGRVPLKDAQYLAREGYAIVVSSDAIQIFSKPAQIRSYIIERDGHTCRYCGNPADAIDCRASRHRRTSNDCFATCTRCLGLRNNMPYGQFVKRYTQDILSEVWAVVDTLSECGIEVVVSRKRRR